MRLQCAINNLFIVLKDGHRKWPNKSNRRKPITCAYLIQKFLYAIGGKFLDLQQNKYRFVALIH